MGDVGQAAWSAIREPPLFIDCRPCDGVRVVCLKACRTLAERGKPAGGAEEQPLPYFTGIIIIKNGVAANAIPFSKWCHQES